MYDGTTKGEYRIMLQGVGNKVFRYGSASEESIQAFADERLYLSAPVVFNGPFESDMYVNFHKAWERVTYELERYERDYLGGKNKDGFQIVTPFNRGLFMEIIDDPEKKKEFEEKVRREVIDTTEKLGKMAGWLTSTRIICLIQYGWSRETGTGDLHLCMTRISLKMACFMTARKGNCLRKQALRR